MYREPPAKRVVEQKDQTKRSGLPARFELDLGSWKEKVMKQKAEIGYVTLGMCATNSYFIRGLDGEGKATDDVIFVDPADRGDLLYDRLLEKGLHVKAILLTHAHFDHIWGVADLVNKSGAKIYAPRAEERMLSNPDMNLSADYGRPCTVKADTWLEDGEEFTLCGHRIKCIVTPGHTEGSACYYFEDSDVLMAGDTLFEESVGRTDFPTGSSSEIVRSIREKLLVLPDDVIVYPGHGDLTTIGHERQYNPFVC
jgi:glyoxylase-like metal-dependent hydrolase (beta-lactamase superfamily II)